MTNALTLPIGEPWATTFAADEDANVAARAAAAAAVFSPAFVPMTADTIALYAELLRRPTVAGFADALAAYHARAIATHPELARALRSPEALADVGEAAARGAAPSSVLETHAIAQARASRAAIVHYQVLIARQLASVDGHELQAAAQRLLDCEVMAVRLEAARAQHEAHAQAQLAAVEAERRAAARVVVDQTVERVRAAAVAAEDLRLRATLAEREYRAVRADALVERLRASGLRELRIGGEGERTRALYDVAELVRTASAMSLAQIGVLETALAAHEAAR